MIHAWKPCNLSMNNLGMGCEPSRKRVAVSAFVFLCLNLVQNCCIRLVCSGYFLEKAKGFGFIVLLPHQTWKESVPKQAGTCRYTWASKQEDRQGQGTRWSRNLTKTKLNQSAEYTLGQYVVPMMLIKSWKSLFFISSFSLTFKQWSRSLWELSVDWLHRVVSAYFAGRRS